MAVRTENLGPGTWNATTAEAPGPQGYDRPGFWAHFFTMMQTAFNDNVLKYLIIFFLLDAAMDDLTFMGIRLDEYRINAIGTVVFSLPWILLPGIVGAISDRWPKKYVMVFSKFTEFGLMGLTFFAFLWGSPLALFGLLFFMAAQSALYGPGKYGILPEAMPESRLSWANGIFQMGTLIAIIAGVVAAGTLYDYLGENFNGDYELAAFFLMGCSAIGIVGSLRIFFTPAANRGQRLTMNPWAGMPRYLGIIWRSRILRTVTVGYCFFWFAGIVVNSVIVVQCESELGMSESTTSIVLALTSVGIGLGALVAGFVSRNKVELGLVPLGTVGMAACALALGLANWPMAPGEDGALAITTGGVAGMVALLMGLGFGAGFFDVPLAASVQKFAPPDAKGGILAATNMLTFLGMLFGGVFFFLCGELGLDGYDIYLVIGCFSLMVGTFMVWSLPLTLVRAGLWTVNNTFLRTKTLHAERIPDNGGALLVCNHTSLVDALFLLSSTDRTLQFVIGGDADSQPWSARITRMLPHIKVPVDADQGALDAAVREIRERIAEGHVVVVPNTARLHKNGPRLPWFNNFHSLTDKLDAPVIPVHITTQWNILFDVRDGQLQRKKPKKLPHTIYVNVGEPVAPEAPESEAARRIMLQGTETYKQRPLRHPLLHRGFITAARKNLRHLCIADNTTGELTYFKALVGSIVFARKLNQVLDKQEKVGVLLPTTVGGTLTNIALQIMGRVPVNLNYTASNAAIASAAKQCNITQVITAKAFLERMPVEVPGEPIFLEDVRKTVSGKDRIAGMLIGLLAPVTMLERICGSPGGRSENDVATIVFSSGSEGDPKGVVLTHRNVMSNLEAALEIFPHGKGDAMMGFLPFFHSFGFTVTLWMSVMSGLNVALHPNPLEPKIIGQLTEKYRATLLIGTSTFLQGIIRRCTPEQMQSLRFVVCGAEKLAPRVRSSFAEKFGVEPLEGYGTTECAPVVSVNLPSCESPGFYVARTKHGTIGQPLPGVSVRVVDADTGEPVARGESGMLEATGPNIMQGYLHLPEKTDAVLHDGWYTTGDIATLDDEGFITITDRLSRFSKIAGEMVPHNKIEESLHDLLELKEQRLAVTSVTDDQKGERLVVLHTLSTDEVNTLIERMGKSDLPNLWRPRASAFYQIDEIPVLGTGKMDIKSVKQLATTRHNANA